jgi:hypothetical protein
MSYAPQVMMFTNDDHLLGNGLRFATPREAEAWIAAAFGRRTLKRNARIIISDDPVNYAWADGKLHELRAGYSTTT